MPVVGRGELEVSPKLARDFAQQLRRQASAVSVNVPINTSASRGSGNQGNAVSQQRASNKQVLTAAQQLRKDHLAILRQWNEDVRILTAERQGILSGKFTPDAKDATKRAKESRTAQIRQIRDDENFERQTMQARLNKRRADQRLLAQIEESEGKKLDPARRKALGIEIDDEPARRGLSRIGQSFKNLDSIAENALGKVGLSVRTLSLALGAGFLAGDAVAIALRSAIAGIKSAITNASNLNEAISATGVLFKDAAAEVLQFANSTAIGMGLSKREALELADTIGVLYLNTNATTAVAAELSTALIGLAADIASILNVQGGAAEVANNFRAALVGQSESVRRYGIDTSETAVANVAAAESVAKVGQELSAQAKVYLRTAIIARQSAFAYGDFANTSDNLANSLRISKAVGEEASAALGQALLPAAIATTKAMTGLKIVLRGVVEALAEGASEADSFGQGLLKNVARSIGSFVPVDAVKAIFGAFAAVGENAEDAARKSQLLRSSLVDTFTLSIAQAKRAQEAEKFTVEGLQKMETAALQVPAAFLGLQQAHLGVAQAALAVRQAEQSLVDLRRQQARQAHEIAQAELGVARARIAQQRADLNLRKQQFESGDILSGLDRQEREIDLQIRLQEATLALTEAQQGQAKAAAALMAAQAGLMGAYETLVRTQRSARFDAVKLFQAQAGVAEALQKTRDAKKEATGDPLKIRKAEIALTKVQREASRFNEEQTMRETEAALALESANLDVKDAALAVISADYRLIDAHDAVRDIALQVEAAQLALRGAHLQVMSAADAAGQASVRLADAQARARGETLGLGEASKAYAEGAGPQFESWIRSHGIPAVSDYAAALAQAQRDAAALSATKITPEFSFTPPNIVGMGDAVSADFNGVGGLEFDGSEFADLEDRAFRESQLQTSLLADIAVNTGGRGTNTPGNQFGGPLPGIPGAQFGTKIRQQSLIRVGEAGPEILAIRPGHRPEVIPNGKDIGRGDGPLIGELHVHEVASSALATARAIDAIIGENTGLSA